MVASVALFPDNPNEAKHVESRLLPRLDEGSTPSSSTKQAVNERFAKYQQNTTHILTVFYFYLTTDFFFPNQQRIWEGRVITVSIIIVHSLFVDLFSLAFASNNAFISIE